MDFSPQADRWARFYWVYLALADKSSLVAFALLSHIVRYAISHTAFYREIWADRLRIIKRRRRTLVARLDAEKWLEKLRSANL